MMNFYDKARNDKNKNKDINSSSFPLRLWTLKRNILFQIQSLKSINRLITTMKLIIISGIELT